MRTRVKSEVHGKRWIFFDLANGDNKIEFIAFLKESSINEVACGKIAYLFVLKLSMKRTQPATLE